MKRGDVVTVASGGGYGGKPRPALIVQADALAERGTIILLGFTSTSNLAVDWRPIVEPDAGNGLDRASVVMTDAPIVAPRTKIGPVIGMLSNNDMRRVEVGLAIVFGL